MMYVNDPWVRLEPLRSVHYEALFEAETSWATGAAWRFNGRNMSFGQYVDSLWPDVVGNVAVHRHDGTLLGVVLAYDADHRSGTVWVASLAVDPQPPKGYMLIGVYHVITELFHGWPFRLVLGESAEPFFKSFSGGAGKVFREQGRLKRQRVVNGDSRDVIYFAVRRDDWMVKNGARCLKRRRAFQATA